MNIKKSFLIMGLFLILCCLAGCGKSTSKPEEAATPIEVPELTEEEIAKYVSDDGYVNPAAYGAVGDGLTDDSEALQMAIDSGYNVRLLDTTYYIAADKHLNISGKRDFHMEGGRIHKEASPDNFQLLVLKDCVDCSFSDMSIYSEFTCKDILVPKNHWRPRDTLNSNVLAFSGTGNTNILFKNNTFDHMGADYWFNATEDSFWKDITVDGWTSSTSLMPMYTQCVTGLTVKNAFVSLNPGCGDGDHCMYVCYKTSDVTIENSSFTGNDSEDLKGAVVVLTFHGGNDKKDTQPKNILIRSCTIEALSGRAFYCEDGTDITVYDSSIVQDGNTLLSGEHDCLTPVFGYGSFAFSDSNISAENLVFEGLKELNLSGCNITGAVNGSIITNVDTVKAKNTKFHTMGGAAVYMNEKSHPDHMYDECIFEKTGDDIPYLFSDRSAKGSITLKNCVADLDQHWFSYNGSNKGADGYSLIDTDLSNCLGMNMGE